MPAERITQWIEKGEVVQGYYNPSNFFDEIHILLLNDDKPSKEDLLNLCGRAKVHVHNYPEPQNFLIKTLGYRPFLLNRWASGVIPLIRKINPDLIRCYGAFLNVYLAYWIKRTLRIPYTVSLHINPDVNFRKFADSLKQKILFHAVKAAEVIGLRNASKVLPVYTPIVRYLKSIGVTEYQVSYNAVNSNIQPKANYKVRTPVRIISAGRLVDLKNPINIIKAVAKLKDVQLEIYGDGPLRATLEAYIQSHQIGNRIKIHSAISNQELCKKFTSSDILAITTHYYEFSKVIIESSFAGLPILINHPNTGLYVEELYYDNCYYVEDSEEGYTKGINELISNEKLRSRIGRNAHHFVTNNCLPAIVNDRLIKLYRELMK